MNSPPNNTITAAAKPVSKWNQAGRKFRSYDKFSVGKPQMKVDFEGAGPAYKSYMGAAVSIIFIVLSSIFLYSKFMILVNVS